MPRIEAYTFAALAAVLTAVATVARVETYEEPSGVRARPSDKLRGQHWLQECLETPSQLYVESRLWPEVFEDLVGYLRANELVADGKHISVEEKVLTFFTITVNFHKVLDGMLHLYQDYVKPPSETTPPQLLEDPRQYPFF
ncbi:hypothetical protein K458DRAFT_389443 [Lentithecium fluviatile CBS 122367]|uniref:DUF8040 domain-containing protein n=1 Tax=Lentithecium fluviatile CBS 122367 TaxID=1168545 RepID=A0A6G1J150_9PLEO|nr:hypothetical protein K458DRAFT_389443 [Lentithecium fluviatile CBS 122367]